jgi:hypothetical protein
MKPASLYSVWGRITGGKESFAGGKRLQGPTQRDFLV